MSKVIFYKAQLQRLFPQGKLFKFFDGSNQDKLVAGIADELARIDDRGDKILQESDPRTTEELLPEWEEMLGLPDECGSNAVTVQDRRNQILQKLKLLGGQSKALYVELAQQLGYDVSIEDVIEYQPFVAGSRAGDRLTNGPWQHTWAMIIPEFTVRPFVAGSYAGERLVEFGDDLLECIITKYKPAQTIVLFIYE